ncbi:MAG TPA: DNA recombination protein RmuC [Candidatus Paceibacterota bacterium]
MPDNLLLILILFVGVALVFFWQWRKGNKKEDTSGLLMIQNQLNELRSTIDGKLGDSAKMFQQQYSESVHVIRDITERLTKLDETNKQVIGFADQLQNLQDILQNPKQRGILGEYYLEAVLKNVLPPGAYKMQYEFHDTSIVDAVIFVKDKIIPIDSKFSLENYNRLLGTKDLGEREQIEKLFRQDLKNRIDETAQYVKPEEGTLDFAFMFIPSEAVFYDVLINKVGTIEAKDLIQYAFQKKVIIVSPTSFMAYLQTVLQGLRALQIEESAKEIRKRVEDLGRHLASYEIYMQKLGTHLGTTVNTYNIAYKELGKVDKDIVKITDGSGEIEVVQIQKPETDEA